MSPSDKDAIPDFLLGRGKHFTALLIRLIAKADSVNLERLRKGFPEEVEAVIKYRHRKSCGT